MVAIPCLDGRDAFKNRGRVIICMWSCFERWHFWAVIPVVQRFDKQQNIVNDSLNSHSAATLTVHIVCQLHGIDSHEFAEESGACCLALTRSGVICKYQGGSSRYQSSTRP